MKHQIISLQLRQQIGINYSQLKCDQEDFAIYKVLVPAVYLIAPPIFLLFGTVGNLLSCITVWRVCKESSASVHLAAQAIGNIIAVWLFMLPSWMKFSLGIFPLESSDWVCKVAIFVNITAGDVGIWTVVAVSIDRFCAVWFPLKAKSICTKEKAIRIVAFIVFLGILKNAHLLYSWGVSAVPNTNDQLKLCGPISSLLLNYETFIRPWVAFITVSAIPEASIIFFNAALMIGLFRYRARMQRDFYYDTPPLKRSPVSTTPHSELTPLKSSPLHHINPSNLESRNSPTLEPHRGLTRTQIAPIRRLFQMRQRHSLLLTLTVSTSFLLFVTPIFLVTTLKMLLGRTDCDALFDGLEALANIGLYSKYSFDFFLYCFASRSFREKVLLFFKQGTRMTLTSQQWNLGKNGSMCEWAIAYNHPLISIHHVPSVRRTI